MNMHIDCVPCLVRQVIESVKMVTDDIDVQTAAIRDALRALSEADFERSAPEMARYTHRIIRKHLKNADPYKSIKEISNARALEIRPAMERKVLASDDPFAAAVKLSIAGNIIDYGVKVDIDTETIDRTIENALSMEVSADELATLRERIESAESILYLADNAGEIVFDKLLIERLPMEKVTLAVRGEPIINDALREDAELAGLTDLVRVIDNGADLPGTVLSECSPEFRQAFEAADLIISKGQGNLETLIGTPKNICFLLLVKCPQVARELGLEEGRMVVLNSRQLCTA